MWIFAMFDLPTDTRKARKAYTDFRKRLMQDGFTMLQYSVYVRHCSSEENADVHYNRISSFLPPDGEVRLITLTDKQFARMETYWGKMRKPAPRAPRQLELF
jgi:CRISPR-associated protein Cas2